MQDYWPARKAMVDCQVRPSDVTRTTIIDAMLAVPREKYVPSSQRPVAYVDQEVPLTKGRALLAPRTFSKMLDTVEIGPGDSVLDIGCGYGYSSAVIARLCRGVIAVEVDETMFSAAESTLLAAAVDNAAVLQGPLEAGMASEGPFDVIIVEGAVASEPTQLFDQLKDGGRLIAVWDRAGIGQVRLSVRSGDDIATRWIFDANAPVLPGFEATPSFAF